MLSWMKVRGSYRLATHLGMAIVCGILGGPYGFLFGLFAYGGGGGGGGKVGTLVPKQFDPLGNAAAQSMFGSQEQATQMQTYDQQVREKVNSESPEDKQNRETAMKDALATQDAYAGLAAKPTLLGGK